METVTVNGTPLAWKEKGSGIPIVFIHGSVGDLRSFQPQFDSWSAHHRVIAFSRRFHPPNRIVDNHATYLMQTQVDDLAALLVQSGAAPAHLIGGSYGGYVAVILALQRPELVRTLVLGEPPMLPLLHHTEEGDQAFVEFYSSVLAPSRASFEKGEMEDGLRKFMDGILGGTGSFDRLQPTTQAGLMKFAPEMQLEMMSPFETYMPDVTAEQMKSIHMPTLLLNGAHSPRIFHLIIDELERHLPNKERKEITGAGHNMHMGNIEEYNKVVTEFLQKID